MNLLTQTPGQQERSSRDRRIIADYQTLRKAYPNAPVSSILRTLESSQKFGLKAEGIKRVLIASGTITPKPRKTT